MEVQTSDLSRLVPETLLSKQWSFVCILSTSLYLLLLILLYYNDQYQIMPSCNASVHSHANWISLYVAMTFGACLGSFLVKLTKLTVILFTNSLTVDTHAVIVSLLFMLFVSSGLNWFIIFKGSANSFHNTNFLCENSNGVKLSIFSLIELLISIPLMYYINISFDGKTKLLNEDYTIIFLSFTYSLANVITFYNINIYLSKLLLIYSLIAIITAFYINNNQANTKYNNITMHTPVAPADIMLHRICQRRCENTLYLGYTLPCLPVLLLFNITSYMNKDLILLLILLLNFIFKVLYAIFILEEHAELLDPNSFKLLHERTSNDARRNFLRYVFHEVRVPLNSISMGLHLLHDDVIVNNNTNNEKINVIIKSILDTIDMMRESTHFMAETLNDVLSIQKIEEGKLELNYEQFYTVSIVKSVTLSLKQQISSKQIYIEIDIQDNVPAMIIGDRFRIEHVLTNLLSNSIKFSANESKIKIVVSYNSVDNYVCYKVIDQGIGISEEDQKLLFTNPLNENTSSQSPKHKGVSAGVGLTICREIVRLHGGTIGFTSKLRQGNDITTGGSEFYFTLPINNPNVNSSAFSDIRLNHNINNAMKTRSSLFLSSIETNNNNSSSPSADSEDTPNSNSSESNRVYRVLIVDDVLMNRKMLNNILKKKGVIVDMAEDGLACINTVTSQPLNYYDIIFMDNQMPRMNGLEATKLLREKGYNQIIAGITGNAMDDDIIEFEQAGADLVLPKPLKMTTLDAFLIECQKNNFQSSIINENGLDKN